MQYDPDFISAYYDEYGEREWERHERWPHTRVSFYLHCHYLAEYIRAGAHVLEAGAGAGRFTVELAKLGARITVGDISEGQLALNREKVPEAGYEDSVVTREVIDIVNLSQFDDEQFDATVCYGGPISYVMERAGDAVAELLRVTKAGGYVLLSVMSLLGSTGAFFDGIYDIIREHGLDVVQEIIETGDLPDTEGVSSGHRCHMYRWSELKVLLERHDCEIVTASAANFLSASAPEAVEPFLEDENLWQQFLAWERDFCRQPGALDGGTHIIAVVRRT